MLSKFFIISILISSLIFCAYSYNGHLLCLEDQKSLLLQLKNELIFDSSISTKLVQWNQTHDCCNWNGVDCDSAGHVISLQLDHESISGGIGDSSSLFRLKYLEKLNLACNNFSDFEYTPIPKGIHRLNYLTHLNLSNAGFGGQVPFELSFLTRLVSLDISYILVDISLPFWNVYYYGSESVLILDNLEVLLQNLTGLREFYLDGANITSSNERRKWSQIVSSYLPHLTTFSCVYCSLSGSFARSFSQLHSLSTLRLDWNDLSTPVPAFFANFSRLTTLSLRYCSLKGSFPNMIFHIPTLQNLDLSGNVLLSGSLPPFTHNGSLQCVRLWGTNFSGLIPSSISNLKNLSELDLSGCKFTGSIFPSTFANLTQLTYVDLSRNSFSGNIPHSLFALPSLTRLRLYENLFSGTFQLEKIRSLANLTRLGLSGNNLTINVSNDNSTSYGFPMLTELGLGSCNLNDFPDFIKHLGMIEYMDLSNNGIGGEIPSWIWELPQLQQLDLSNNRIGGKIRSWIWGLTQLGYLNLSNNGIGGEMPSWIWGLTQLRDLDLSHNLLTGLQKPCHIPSSLVYLDLSSNQLRGKVIIPPNVTSGLNILILSNNSLSGPIPTSLCTAIQLVILDLSSNKLSGSIPSCLFDPTINSLNVVDLGRNMIRGRISDNFPLLSRLNYLDLNNNTLEGEIPRSLKNCHVLEFINVGNNIISDTFPCMLPSSLRVLVLYFNRFHGEVTSCDHNN